MKNKYSSLEKGNKQAGEVYMESEKVLRSLYENTTIGLYRTTPDGRVLLANPALISMLGFESFDELNQRCLENEGYEAEYPRSEFKKCIENEGKVIGFESWWLKKDGSTMYILENAKAIRNDKGQTIYYEGTVEDITKRKQAEMKLEAVNEQLEASNQQLRASDLELRESEERYRLVSETARELIIIHDYDGNITYANKFAANLLEVDQKSLVGENVKRFLPLDQEKKMGRRKKLIDGLRGPTVFESEVVSPSGRKYLVEIDSMPFKDSKGAQRILTIGRDITERKRFEIIQKSLYKIASSVHATKNMEDLSRLIQIELGNVIDTKFFFIALYNEENDSISLAYHEDEKDKFETFPAGKTCTAYVIKSEKSLLANNKKIEELIQLGKIENVGEPSKMWLGVPLKVENDVVGALVVQSYTDENAYDEKDLELLEFVSSQIGLSIEHKRSDEKVLESEEKYHLLVENVPSVLWKTSEKGITVFISSNIKEVYGYTPEEIYADSYHSWFGRIHHNDLQEVEKSFQALFHKGKKFDVEYRIKRKDGEWIWIRNVASVVHEENGERNAYGVFTDITERKHAEEALKSSGERLKILFESAPDAYYLNDIKGTFIDGNKAAEDLLGYKKEELIGKSFLKLKILSAKELLKASKLLVKNIQGKGTGPDEFILNCKDGSQVSVEIRTYPVQIKDKTMVLGIARDVTERKQAEKALKESEEKYRNLVETIIEGIADVDENENFRFVNQASANIFGYSKEELVKKNLKEFVTPDEYQRIREQTAIRGKNKSGKYEISITNKNGDNRIIEVSATPRIGVNGKILSTFGIFHDITERKRAEAEKKAMQAQLLQSQKLESIGTLASGVAHEINNPLMGMINYADLINSRIKDDTLKEFSASIIEEGDRVAKIVRNLLSFARQDKESHSPASIKDIIEASLSLIGAVLRKDQITLIYDIPKDLPMIKCRSQQIEQVIINLLTNTRDSLNERYPYYDEDKIVKISVKPLEKDGVDWIRTTIEDHGVGMQEDVIERIFDPFFTTKPRDIGTGLGLSVSYGLIKEHGGELSVESEPGKYSRFHIDLPVNNGWQVGNDD